MKKGLRILHTSDWHLGKSFFSRKLTQVQARLFEEEIFPLLKEVRPDVFVVSGDIVDKPNPDYETLQLLKEVLLFLSKERINSLFILGNHDSKRISLFKEFLEGLNIWFFDDLSGFFSPLKVEGETGDKVYLFAFPYLPLFELIECGGDAVKVMQSKNEDITYKEVVRVLFDWVKARVERLRKEGMCICVGHFAVSKGALSGEEEVFAVGHEEVVSEKILSTFDVSLLGHLHRMQELPNCVFYSGSPMPYSFDESTCEKGMWLLEVKEGKILKKEKVLLSSPVEVRVLKGRFNELISHRPLTGFVKVILLDEVPVFRAFERLKRVFPNLLALEYETKPEALEDKTLEFLDEKVYREGKISLGEEELFVEFLRFVKGKGEHQELKKVFKEVLKEFKERKNGLK